MRERVTDFGDLLSTEPELKKFTDSIDDSAHRENLKSAIDEVLSGDFGTELLLPESQLIVGRVVADDKVLSELITTIRTPPIVVLHGGYFLCLSKTNIDRSLDLFHPRMKRLSWKLENTKNSRVHVCGTQTMAIATDADLVSINFRVVNPKNEIVDNLAVVNLQVDPVPLHRTRQAMEVLVSRKLRPVPSKQMEEFAIASQPQSDGTVVIRVSPYSYLLTVSGTKTSDFAASITPNAFESQTIDLGDVVLSQRTSFQLDYATSKNGDFSGSDISHANVIPGPSSLVFGSSMEKKQCCCVVDHSSRMGQLSNSGRDYRRLLN